VLEVPIDIFDRDRRIVHQDANGKCEAAQGHDVDGLAEQRKRVTEARMASVSKR